DVGRLAEQARVLHHLCLAAAREDHDLDLGPVARLQRAHGIEAEAAIGVAQQRGARAEQGAVEVDVYAAEHARESADFRPAARARLPPRVVAVSPDREPWTALLERGRAEERLVHEDVVPPRPGRAVPIPRELHHELRDALERVGIAALHAHQEQALLAAMDG